MASSSCALSNRETFLKIISYNLHGLNHGSVLLSQLVDSNDADLIFVQEY